MKGFLTLLVLAAISAAVFSLGKLSRKGDDKSLLNVAKAVPLTVHVATPKREPIVRIVQAPGDVEAVLEVEISSEIVSKIEEMPVEEGNEVKKGDLLCRLDDRNLRADVESAQAHIDQLKAAIVQADADLEKSERDLARQVRLSEANATSDIELRDYKTARDKFKAIRAQRQFELEQAQAMLKRINEDLVKTVIRSPIDGVISRLNAKQGEVVVTGTMNNPGTVIMSISDLSHMQVRARVDEIDVPLVKADQTARIYLQADPDRPVPARVARVASKGVKQQGRDVVTFETLLDVLGDDERIMPGMTANVEIEVAREDDAITIPVEAVVHRMRKELSDDVVAEFDRQQANLNLSERAKQAQYLKVVYVKDGDTAHVRLVDPGIADTRRVEIRNGIALTDTVIVGPYRSLDQLKDGKAVALADDDKKAKEKTGEAKESLAAKNDEKKPGEESKDQKGEKKDGRSGDGREANASATKRP
jgi:HlyD family secretion protein